MGVAEPRKLDSIRVFVSTGEGKSNSVFVQPTALIEDFVESLHEDIDTLDHSYFIFEGKNLSSCGFSVLFLL